MSFAVRNDLRGWRAVGGVEDVAQDEHYCEERPELPVDVEAERAWRDGALTALVWLRDRHRDQLEIGAATTLTPEQFTELLEYMQQLRDWPQSEAFPDSSARPVPPAFLKTVGGEQ
ncbi:phage tail assembly chaperone [Pseudomonas sp. zfem004]|uniref:phage tail assembly chaperone n=1 Tax=Pseudomonas sp. zfem004 TaxID=3078199 RepID=UPI0029288008|nr:phage tail assembly chaperone [Pseudomonas sp. zfem004]MDU9402520.1 phage tail assembly chaperone [Pseudomonas sp. zfem004]